MGPGRRRQATTTVQREIEQIEAELVEVRARMAGYLKELGFDEIEQLSKDDKK